MDQPESDANGLIQTNEARDPAEVDRLVNRAWREARRGAIASPEKTAMLIARTIVREIGSGKIKSGDSLPSEAEMVAAYGVGRTSIREALRILEVQGLVAIKTGPGGGPVVKDPTTADAGRMLSLHLNVRGSAFGDLARARLILDPMLAQQAALSATPSAIERLRDIVELMEKVEWNNHPEWARTASMFNAIVAAASGNSVLALISASLRAIYAEQISRMQFTARFRKAALVQYNQIISAIERRDAEAAHASSFKLIDASIQQMGKNYPDTLRDVIDWN